MTICAALTERASDGVAPALRAVDCLAGEATGAAFGRLFGTDGALLPALTLILTLYIGFFAVSLLTGRARLGISALTPRALTLGLILTFVTSWVAYQGVVWNLAVGAPDQIAGVLMDTKGSATQLFADRVDLIFTAIAEAGQNAGGGTQGAVQQTAAQGTFTPGNLMWLAALLLLLGTVGVLVTARIALAVLLALGPIFVVFSLFPGTRGLTAGWLRGVVMTAVTPLFVVLGGGLMLELLVPVVAELRGDMGIDGRAALALFTMASVHVALMAMVLKVGGTIVGNWQVFGLSRGEAEGEGPRAGGQPIVDLPATSFDQSSAPGAAPRRQIALPAFPPRDRTEPASATASGSIPGSITRIVVDQVFSPSHLPPLPPARSRGVGSRFRAPPRQVREMSR